MGELIGFKFKDYSVPIKPNWSSLNGNVLQLSFIWDRKINIIINSKGEVIRCSSLMRTTDNIDYYITMGENLKKIKSFCENKGEELFTKVKDITKENDKEKKYNKLKELEKEYEQYL